MVIFGNNAVAVNGSGTLNLTNNFKLTTATDVRAVTGNNTANLNVYGSGGLFSVGGNFSFTNSKASLNFIADAAGFTTINVSSNINIAGSTLNLNLDAYTGSSTNLVLMNGASLSGTFSSVNFTGTRSGTVIYDPSAGEVRLILASSRRIGLIVISSIIPVFRQ
jgi:hypothetical protein